MANNLTGDYEAVVQISVRQLNGLLATLHQNGAKGSNLSPSFPHSVANLRVGDEPKYLQAVTTQFSGWLNSAVQSFQGAGAASVTATQLAATAPPGIAEQFRKSLIDLSEAWKDIAHPGSIRGRAEVQVSTPAITLVRTEVIVHVYIRARYIPDPGTAALPDPIHGEVRISYQLIPKSAGGKNVLEVAIPSDDSRIQFFPATGSLSQADADNLLAVHIRKAVRERFKATPVDLPNDFKFFEFKSLGSFGNLIDHQYRDALGTGSEQALVLPMQMSGNPAAPGALDRLNNLFLGTGPTQSDFAIAVSKEFITTKFQPTLDKLRQIQKSFVISVPVWPDPTYHMSVTGVDLQFKAGSIDLVIHAKATTNALVFPNFNNIVVTQGLKLVLVGQTVTLQAADSDLTITGLSSLAMGKARTEIISQRDKALPTAQAALASAFQDALKGLNGGLVKLDSSALASFTAVEISPDGIVVRGAIDTKYHYQPQMEIGYTEDGNSFTALNCWIPGGRIANFTWYWVETTAFTTPGGGSWVIPWWGKPKSYSQAHRFTFTIPAAIKGRPGWSKGVCLAIDGDQVDSNGKAALVTGFDQSGTCKVTSHEPILVVDPLWEAIYGILWLPDPALAAPIEDGIAAHINALAHPRPEGGLTTNALVHFPGARSERPLEVLGQAIASMRRPNLSLTVVIVMPAGTFRNSRGAVEESLGVHAVSGPALRSKSNEDQADVLFSTRLLITEDYAGGWSRTFAAKATPSSYLMNARGEFVWKQEGKLDAATLTTAMDEHFLPAPAPRALPLRLTVQPGERALDAMFDDGQVALHRLRGRQVLLNFWQSWSAPCIRELRRLQRLHEQGERGLVILAVNGGEERTVAAEAFRQHHLTLTLVHDAGQRIAQLYGVHCWPTTLSINPDGVVDRIQFGVTHTAHAEVHGKKAT